MGHEMRNWLLQQMNAEDSLDGIAVVTKIAVKEFGPSRVAEELRLLADYLEATDDLPGWSFPKNRA